MMESGSTELSEDLQTRFKEDFYLRTLGTPQES